MNKKHPNWVSRKNIITQISLTHKLEQDNHRMRHEFAD